MIRPNKLISLDKIIYKIQAVQNIKTKKSSNNPWFEKTYVHHMVSAILDKNLRSLMCDLLDTYETFTKNFIAETKIYL